MLFEIPYATFSNYSPRGQSPLSQRSRKVCAAIKAGKTRSIESALPHIKGPKGAVLAPFLNPAVTLVPIPRSAPLKKGALWPGRVIADVLADADLAADVLPCLERVTAIRKSSSSPAHERPLFTEHYETLAVEAGILRPAEITLVDDVLTMGRTVFACARRIEEAFPDATIRVFAMIRTQGFVDDIEAMVDPSAGIIKGYPSGKTHREP